MTAHKHAALMLQYAQDAAETDRPWERWETSESKTKIGDTWVQDWEDLTENPDWHPNVKYRRKPQVIRVGRHEFPKPVIEAPTLGATYYFADFSANKAAFVAWHCTWRGDAYDVARLKGNICHLSEADAKAHADVLNAICRGDVD